jgi:GntR family transcriptional regulator
MVSYMGAMTAIDKKSPVPYYHQLKTLIVQDITQRGLERGDRLAGDFELCEQYGVSRTVVRQALRELEYDGVVVRERGRGTFVGDRKTSQGFGNALIGSFEDIQSGKGSQRTHVLRGELVPATLTVARDLGIEEGVLVVEIERVRLVDGEPWAYTVTQLPEDIGSGLLNENLEDASIYGVLERQLGVRFDRAQRTIEAGTAPAVASESLGIAPGEPVLIMRSISYDHRGVPVERFTGYHRGDRSRLDVEVRRSNE